MNPTLNEYYLLQSKNGGVCLPHDWELLKVNRSVSLLLLSGNSDCIILTHESEVKIGGCLSTTNSWIGTCILFAAKKMFFGDILYNWECAYE